MCHGTSGPEGTQPYELVRVYFATNRNFSNQTDVAKRFGNARAPLSYGAVAVAIPREHRLAKLETPSIFKLEFRKDPARHVSLTDIQVLSKEKWRGELQQRATSLWSALQLTARSHGAPGPCGIPA